MSRIARMQRAALASHALLIAGLALIAGRSIGLLLLLPLLAPLRGIWRGERYTCGWASMLVTFYCAGLLAEAYMRPSQAAALHLLAGVAAVEFVSLVLLVRLKARQARAESAAAPSAARTAG